uniref:Uncharacterized protein n=1 Tax=Tanacetum cinerariifolium TaxID=118510 RepID=A0A699Q249_TANCI|nr:hypothetical protein [Tanacetum cinerariifolium]
MDELEPHLAYDFFAPEPLPRYVGNLNNNNGWIEADVPILRELGAEVDEPMIDLVIDEVAKPIVEGEEQGFEDDEEVWEVGGPSTGAAEGQSFTLPAPRFPVSDVEVADGITIRKISPIFSGMEGQVHVMASQTV